MTIIAAADPEISDTSPPVRDGDLLVYGPLTLDTARWILTGPSGWLGLRSIEREMLLVLMAPQVVSFAKLAAVAFPSVQQPRNPEHAMAVRIARLRTVLETVGVSGDAIQAFTGVGYGLGMGGTVARTYTGKRVRLLDAILASHPDREAVAELEAFMR